MGLAWASFTVPTSIGVDMSVLADLTLMLLACFATVWVLRKLIKTINRS